MKQLGCRKVLLERSRSRCGIFSDAIALHRAGVDISNGVSNVNVQFEPSDLHLLPTPNFTSILISTFLTESRNFFEKNVIVYVFRKRQI